MNCKKHGLISVTDTLYHSSGTKVKKRCAICERNRAKSYRKNNWEKIKASRKKHKETINKSRRKSIENLSDSYIRNILKEKTSLSFGDISDELVYLKKSIILLNRKIRGIKNGNKKS